jgi:hypothetical protein
MSHIKDRLGFGICHLVFVICLILGFLLRLAPLGRYVTPDEPAWVDRSVRFADALARGDWRTIPVTGHPGATTMWLGALGVQAARTIYPGESSAHVDFVCNMAWLSPESGAVYPHLVYFLPWGRTAVVLATTLGLAILYPLLIRLSDRRTALLSVGLLAFDPFLIGHSGLLHTDALLATSTLLALVSALNGLRGQRPAVWWLSAGLFTGLTILTKSPGIILLPFAALIAFIQLIARAGQLPGISLQSLARHLPSTVLHFVLFILATAATCFALYPALWADPSAVYEATFSFAGQHVEAALRPVFFAGRWLSDPGPAYYPAVLLVRASPIMLVGLVIGLAGLRRLPADRRFGFLFLLAFGVTFGTLMSVGVKKHARYLLPALLPLTVAAAVGWTYLGEYASRRGMGKQGNQHRIRPSSTFLLLPALQALIALTFLFYPLAYANPLIGGPWMASRVLWLDWGEGAGSAARWLNQQRDADRLTVATDAVPVVAPVFNGRTVPLDQVSLADYVILPPHLTPQIPHATAHVVTIGMVERTTVYTNVAAAEQVAYLAAHVAEDEPIFLDADSPLWRRYAGPGTIASVAGLPDQAAVANLVHTLSAGRSHIWVVADPSASPITTRYLRRGVESIATPVASESVGGAIITSYAAAEEKELDLESLVSSFGRQITLVDTLLPDQPVSDRFTAFLRWQTAGPTATDLRAVIYLQDAAGRTWVESGQLLVNGATFATSAWTPGEWMDVAMTVRLPAYIPPSSYTVRVAVFDGDGAQLGAWAADGAFQGVRVALGEIEIVPPAEPQGAPDCAPDRFHTAAPFAACILQGPPDDVPSGDAFSISIVWSASGPAEGNYAVRWRLVDTEQTEVLELVEPLSPYPTSRWRSGDTFESRYSLNVDPAIPAGDYVVALNILDPAGSVAWAEDVTLDTIEILHRERQYTLPDDITHPLALTLGDAVHLRGFDLPSVQASPGSTLPLTLYWQADSSTDIDYTVFVHLVGPDGQNHGQLDYGPGGGPTASWTPGQVIVDDLTLPVDRDAPAGSYTIAIGMYDAQSGGRLPITDDLGQRLADDRAILPIMIAIEE